MFYVRLRHEEAATVVDYLSRMVEGNIKLATNQFTTAKFRDDAVNPGWDTKTPKESLLRAKAIIEPHLALFDCHDYYRPIELFASIFCAQVLVGETCDAAETYDQAARLHENACDAHDVTTVFLDAIIQAVGAQATEKQRRLCVNAIPDKLDYDDCLKSLVSSGRV